jgi:hypothetical protein
MPPRFAYWTIIAGGLPTAFRAADREELLPTFTRLKQKQPDAEMKWFARGKLWESPEEARSQRDRAVGREQTTGRDKERHRRPDGQRESRGRDWRPGGDHRDPRQPFKDAKKARNQRIKAEKFARKTGRDEAPRERPHGDPVAPERRPRPTGPRGSDAVANRKPWNGKPQSRGGSAAPAGPRAWSAKPPREKPHGDPLAPERRPRPSGPRRDDAAANRKPWTAKPGGGTGGGWKPRPPAGDRASAKPDRPAAWQNRGPKPQSRGSSRPSEPGAWTTKPPREKPHGDKLTRPPRTGPERDRVGSDRHRAGEDRDRGGHGAPRTESRWNQKPRSDGRGTYRGEGHGDNSWKPKPPRDDRGAGEPSTRPFAPRGFDRDRGRGANQAPSRPPAPRGPNREPRPNEDPKPSPPPRPSEPVISPPGPPERGRLNRNKRSR